MNETKEKFTRKEIALVVAGILMGILGSIMANYLMMFSKERALEYPMGEAAMAFLITLLFAVLLFCIITNITNMKGWRRIVTALVLLTLPLLISSSIYDDAKDHGQKVRPAKYTKVGEIGKEKPRQKP